MIVPKEIRDLLVSQKCETFVNLSGEKIIISPDKCHVRLSDGKVVGIPMDSAREWLNSLGKI